MLLSANCAFSQGFGVPSKKGGIGFGNLPSFTGIRFNFKDGNVEKVSGINVTAWAPKDDDLHTGDINGISLGLPMALGAENRSGISLGVFGVGAKRNMSGINIGGIGVGAGGDVSGFNLGVVGVGAGGDIKGINIGGIGLGASGDATGFNFGGIGMGAGGSIKGVNLALIGMGASENAFGLNVAGIGMGAGEKMAGINLAVVGIGAGESLTGINIAGVGMGSQKIRGINVALAIGGQRVSGITLAPAFMKVGEGSDSAMNGISVSAVNVVKGDQNGVTIGVVNTAHSLRGIQIGLINYVRDNPRGLRFLPILNMHFGGKRERAGSDAE